MVVDVFKESETLLKRLYSVDSMRGDVLSVLKKHSIEFPYYREVDNLIIEFYDAFDNLVISTRCDQRMLRFLDISKTRREDLVESIDYYEGFCNIIERLCRGEHINLRYIGKENSHYSIDHEFIKCWLDPTPVFAYWECNDSLKMIQDIIFKGIDNRCKKLRDTCFNYMSHKIISPEYALSLCMSANDSKHKYFDENGEILISEEICSEQCQIPVDNQTIVYLPAVIKNSEVDAVSNNNNIIYEQLSLF